MAEGLGLYVYHVMGQYFFASQILLARITKENRFIESTERNLDYWTTGFVQNGKVERITYTPYGLAWLDQWGSLRYTANAAFLAFVYADWVSDEEKRIDIKRLRSSKLTIC